MTDAARVFVTLGLPEGTELKVLLDMDDDNLAFLCPKAYPTYNGTLTAGLLASSLDGVSPQPARDQGWQTPATRLPVLVPTICPSSIRQTLARVV